MGQDKIGKVKEAENNSGPILEVEPSEVASVLLWAIERKGARCWPEMLHNGKAA